MTTSPTPDILLEVKDLRVQRVDLDEGVRPDDIEELPLAGRRPGQQYGRTWNPFGVNRMRPSTQRRWNAGTWLWYRATHASTCPFQTSTP